MTEIHDEIQRRWDALAKFIKLDESEVKPVMFGNEPALEVSCDIRQMRAAFDSEEQHDNMFKKYRLHVLSTSEPIVNVGVYILSLEPS